MARRIALWLTLPTGFAGLVYEVAWEQSLATLVGSHSAAAATVLAIFLGGLASGYAAFGALARRRPDAAGLLRIYGGVELSIGAYAFVFPWLLSGARALSVALPAADDGVAFAADLLLSALLLGPPAAAMGATIPLLTQALPATSEASTRIHARIYALNTGGAFAGALCAAYWILPALGLAGGLRAMAAVNGLAGLAYLALARGIAPSPAPLPPAPAREPVAAALAALLLGFAAMTLQTSMLRWSALSLGGSPFTFAQVVAVFVLCIALGSAAVSALPRVPRWLLAADVGLLFVWIVALHAPLDDGPYYGHWLRTRFAPDASSFAAYQGATFAALLGVIGPAAFCSGASLPLLFDRLRRTRPDYGGVAGRLYAWNTAGSVLGALLGGYALFWWLDLDGVYRVAAGAVAAAAALLAAPGRSLPARGAIAAACLGGLALVAALPAWSPDRLTSGAYRVREPLAGTEAGPDAFFAGEQPPIVFHRDDPGACITVKEFLTVDGRKDRFLATNGKSDSAALTEYPTLALGGLLPALFAEHTRRAFVIGLGTGVTASELARLDGMQEVLVAEISPAVSEAAPLFDAMNGGASTNPRIREIRGDAYRALLRSQGRFDVIFSEPSNPWVGGVEMLFSRELLEEGRRRLAPGGVYAQWLQLYETDARTLGLALRTLTAVFDHVSAWYGDGPDLLLLGHDRMEGSLDVERLARRAARPDFAAGLARAGIDDLPALLAHELLPLGTVRSVAGEGPIHTLLHPRLRHAAARAFHAGASAFLPRLAAPEPARLAEERSLWRRYRRSRDAAGLPLEEWERRSFAGEICRHRYPECAVVLAEWAHEVPVSRARRTLADELADYARERDRSPPPFGRVRELSHLFGEEAMLLPGGKGLSQAQRATRLFASYYHPAAPFAREGLRALWRRCEAEPARRGACVRLRRTLQDELGPLGLERAGEGS